MRLKSGNAVDSFGPGIRAREPSPGHPLSRSGRHRARAGQTLRTSSIGDAEHAHRKADRKSSSAELKWLSKEAHVPDAPEIVTSCEEAEVRIRDLTRPERSGWRPYSRMRARAVSAPFCLRDCRTGVIWRTTGRTSPLFAE
jgi:hypothetical protein